MISAKESQEFCTKQYRIRIDSLGNENTFGSKKTRGILRPTSGSKHLWIHHADLDPRV
jgi:hypothetical protein